MWPRLLEEQSRMSAYIMGHVPPKKDDEAAQVEERAAA